MQKFLWPTSAGRTLASFGHALRRSRNSTATAPPGPVATDGWNWSVGTGASTLSFTTTGAVQVKPPSVDWVNFTSACVPSQSSYVRYRWPVYVGLAAKFSTIPLRKRVFGYTSSGGMVAVVIGTNGVNVRPSSV